MKTPLLTLVFVLIGLLLFAQRMPELIDSKKAIESGIKNHDAQNYEAALIEYYKVNKYDTNYAWALYEIAMTQFAMGDFEKSIQTSKKVLVENPNEANAYVNLGNAYDELKQYENAENAYNDGIAKFPYNHLLYVNKAIMFEKRKEHKKAIETYSELIKFNPMYPSIHLHLGYMNVKEGNLAQGLLSLSTFLMLEPSSNRSFGALQYMSDVATMQSEDYKTEMKNEIENGFKELDLLIANKIALNAKYKTPSKLKLNVIQQMHLIMTEMKKGQGDGFWKDFYGEIYNQILDKEQFETYAILLVASGTSDPIKKALDKNLDDVKAFHQQFKADFRNIHKDYEVEKNGEKQIMSTYFTDSYNLLCFGKENENDVPDGMFYYLYTDGRISSEGVLNTSAKKNGIWKFYNKEGAVIRSNTYVDGMLQGPYKIYFAHGTLKEEGEYKADELNGELKAYHANEALWIEVTYVDGKQNGPFKRYYGTGQLEYDYTNVESEIDGPFKYYFANGNLSDEKTFSKGLLTGERREYFESGQLASIKTYKEGVLEGPYKTYYSHGQVSSEGIATKGNLSGKWLYYSPDGSIKEESDFDESGKVTGMEVLFDYDGKPYRKAEFIKGELKSFQLISADGTVIESAEESKGKILAKNYAQDRCLISEGEISKGKLEGEWKYYYRNGALSSKRMFKDNKLSGDYIAYYPNGEIDFKLVTENGNSEGLSVGYYSDGKTIYNAGNYLNDQKWGMWNYYYPNGTLKSKSYLSAGKNLNEKFEYAVNGNISEKTIYNDLGYIVGIVKYDSNGTIVDSAALPNGSGHAQIKFANGQIRWDANYISGKAEGIFTWSFPNGNISTQGNIVADNREGEWKFYYPFKQLSDEGKYLAGLKEGTWTQYEMTGAKSYERTYLHGQIHGTTFYFYPNGEIEITMEYAYGEKNGASTYYDATGELRCVRYYDHGKLVGYSYNDSDGKLKAMIPIENETVDLKAYYANGNPSAEYSIKNGWFQGPSKLYHSNGSLQRENNFLNDNRDGKIKETFANGKTYFEIDYKYGDIHGAYKEFYENGKTKIVGNYVLGEKQGRFVYYDSNGKSLGTYIYHNGNCIEIN